MKLICPNNNVVFINIVKLSFIKVLLVIQYKLTIIGLVAFTRVCKAISSMFFGAKYFSFIKFSRTLK